MELWESTSFLSQHSFTDSLSTLGVRKDWIYILGLSMTLFSWLKRIYSSFYPWNILSCETDVFSLFTWVSTYVIHHHLAQWQRLFIISWSYQHIKNIFLENLISMLLKMFHTWYWGDTSETLWSILTRHNFFDVICQKQ